MGEANDNSRAKRSKPNEDNGNANDPVKAEDETQKSSADKTNTKPPEPPKDYIHVRARRGQATDSHSLAERVRITTQFSPICHCIFMFWMRNYQFFQKFMLLGNCKFNNLTIILTGPKRED